MNNVCKMAWMIAAAVWFFEVNAATTRAQDRDFQIGDAVELYAGGSAWVIRTEVIDIDENGNLKVRYETPFITNGMTTATLPPGKFWKVGDEPNPAPKNEFRLGDKVEFYFNRTDRVAEGIVAGILSGGSRYTVQYKMRNGQMRPQWLEPTAMWKWRGTKKPLPEGYRKVDAGGRPKSPPAPKPMRTWTAASGKSELTARYLSTRNSSVELEKEDGSTIMVDLDELSLADNQYIEKVRNNDLARRVITDKPVIPFASNQRKLTGGDWDFTLDAAPDSNFLLPHNTVRLSHPIGFGSSSRDHIRFWEPVGLEERTESNFDRLRSWQFSQWTVAEDGKRCFLLANSDFGQSCLLQGMNFESGELEFSEIIDGEGIAISRDGSKVAFLQTSRRGDQRGELIIKEVGEDGDVLQRHVVKAFVDMTGYSPNAGFFVNDSILVTIGRRIVAFDLNRNSGYSTPSFPRTAILLDAAVSPNRKQIAMLSGGGIFIYDVARGKPIGTVRMEFVGTGKIAFSSDGSRLVFCPHFIGPARIFDLATGQVTKTFVSLGQPVTKSVAWPHPRFLLLDNEALFDLELGVVVWRFKTQGSFFDPLFHVGGNTFLSNDGNRNITPVELPLDRIETAASAFPIDDATVLERGDDFRIDLDTTFSPADNEKIVKHFSSQLALRGIRYNEDSDNVFYCRVEQGTRQTARIEVDEDDIRTVHYTPTTCKVELEVDGAVTWQRIVVNTFARHTLVGQKGETPQMAVNRLCRPKPGTFTSILFPGRFILFPGGKDALGHSTISNDGVTDTD